MGQRGRPRKTIETESAKIPTERFTLPNKTKLRNLRQYRDMTDDEFDERYDQIVSNAEPSIDFERRIEAKEEAIKADYDVSDLKANDMLVLRALCQSLINLEDLEQIAYKLRTSELDIEAIAKLDRINKMLTDLRTGISKFQDDLKMSRKIRKADKEGNLINEIEDLKQKAKKFYEQRMSYIFCPKCNMLLATTWFLYPDEERNKIRLVCNRKLDSGERCGETILISSAELLKNKSTNNPNVPEGLK